MLGVLVDNDGLVLVGRGADASAELVDERRLVSSRAAGEAVSTACIVCEPPAPRAAASPGTFAAHPVTATAVVVQAASFP